MKRIFNLIKNYITKIRNKKKFKRKLEELRKRDPFIYK